MKQRVLLLSPESPSAPTQTFRSDYRNCFNLGHMYTHQQSAFKTSKNQHSPSTKCRLLRCPVPSVHSLIAAVKDLWEQGTKEQQNSSRNIIGTSRKPRSSADSLNDINSKKRTSPSFAAILLVGSAVQKRTVLCRSSCAKRNCFVSGSNLAILSPLPPKK